MSALLFEGSRTVTISLAILLVVLLMVYWQTRKRPVLFAGGVILALLGLYLLLDFVVVTEPEADRAQMQQRLLQMAESVSQRNVERLFQHISERFISPQGRDRKTTMAFAREQMTTGRVTEIRVWDVEFEEPPSRTKGEATVRFQFKPIGNVGSDLAFGCEATYEWKSATGWMLKKAVIFNPVMGREAIQPLF